MTFEVKAIYSVLHFGPSTPAAPKPRRTTTFIDDAESIVIAQVRGNSEWSDDKATHFALDALAEQFPTLPRVGGGVRARLDSLTEHFEALGYRGRAVLIGLWCFRVPQTWPKDYDNDMDTWKLISEALRLEGVVEEPSPFLDAMNQLLVDK